MVRKSSGFRSKSRNRLKQKTAVRPAITKFLQQFRVEQDVVLLPEPSSHKGMPHPRFKGKMGKILGKRGKAYIVEFIDGNKVKKVFVNPEHLKAM